MKTCTEFSNCAFANCDNSYKVLQSLDHYISDYCNGDKHDTCIRIQIESKHGNLHVPTNMMPNGLPLPGTHRRDWTEIALEYKKHI